MRQLMLYYREAIRSNNARTAAGIVAANLGFNGGTEASRTVRELLA
ncbi:MAG: hypothetical protein LBI31_07515 [Zoogloeaceae bacterium]|jgi:hypothetical protein|nr:hypothetical protein [Zoogloeaceae bacterium]